MPLARLASLLVLVSSAALADGLQISEPDLQAYLKLYEAKRLAEARRTYSGGDAAKRAAAEATFPKAVQEAGWTQEKFGEIDSEVGGIAELLRMLQATDADKEVVESNKEQLAAKDAAVVAWTRAHAKELDYAAANARAEQRVRDERSQVAKGKPLAKAELQGTWKYDLEATLAHLEATMGVGGEAMRKPLAAQGETTYLFAGDAVEQRVVRPGSKTPEVNKGTFRLEGNDLLIKIGTRENKLQAGMKSPKELVLSMMGVGSIFRKQ